MNQLQGLGLVAMLSSIMMMLGIIYAELLSVNNDEMAIVAGVIFVFGAAVFSWETGNNNE